MAGQASRENGKKGGRPKGKVRLDKEMAREYVRQRVIEELEPLLLAQFAHAKGLKYLVARAKAGGKFERVEATKVPSLDPDTYVVEVWEKDPSVQAFTDLMNRALDKPKEQPQDINLTAKVDYIGILQQRHARRRR